MKSLNSFWISGIRLMIFSWKPSSKTFTRLIERSCMQPSKKDSHLRNQSLARRNQTAQTSLKNQITTLGEAIREVDFQCICRSNLKCYLCVYIYNNLMNGWRWYIYHSKNISYTILKFSKFTNQKKILIFIYLIKFQDKVHHFSQVLHFSKL